LKLGKSKQALISGWPGGTLECAQWLSLALWGSLEIGWPVRRNDRPGNRH